MRRSEWGHAPLREPSGHDSKGGEAANGVERRAEPRAAKGGAPLYKRAFCTRVLGSCWLVVHRRRLVGCSSLVGRGLRSDRKVEFGRCWWWVVRVIIVLVLRSWPGEQPVGGGADGRRSRAGESSLTTPGARGQTRPRKAVGE